MAIETIHNTFLSDGVWVVKDKGCSSSKIAKIEDLPIPFERFAMEMDKDVFCQWWIHYHYKMIDNTWKVSENGNWSYRFKSNCEMMNDFFDFCCLTSEQRVKEVERLKVEHVCIDSDGNINGAIFKGSLKSEKKRLKTLKQKLKRASKKADEEYVKNVQDSFLSFLRVHSVDTWYEEFDTYVKRYNLKIDMEFIFSINLWITSKPSGNITTEELKFVEHLENFYKLKNLETL